MRRQWLLALLLALVSVAIAVALLDSEVSGTGAENVGESGPETVVAPEPDQAAPVRPERHCRATQSNPGGTNNYIPDAPERDSLGSGFVITGVVRSADGCRPLEGVRIQVWLATQTGGEQDNRASVRTGFGRSLPHRDRPHRPAVRRAQHPRRLRRR